MLSSRSLHFGGNVLATRSNNRMEPACQQSGAIDLGRRG
jgi:hypothetical protein